MGKDRRQAQGEHRRPGIEDGSRVRGLRPDVQRVPHRSTVLQSPMSTAGISAPTWTRHLSGLGSPDDPDRRGRRRRLLAVRFGAWTGRYISVLRACRPGGRCSPPAVRYRRTSATGCDRARPCEIVEHITKGVMKWTSDDPDPARIGTGRGVRISVLRADRPCDRWSGRPSKIVVC